MLNYSGALALTMALTIKCRFPTRKLIFTVCRLLFNNVADFDCKTMKMCHEGVTHHHSTAKQPRGTFNHFMSVSSCHLTSYDGWLYWRSRFNSDGPWRQEGTFEFQASWPETLRKWHWLDQPAFTNLSLWTFLQSISISIHSDTPNIFGSLDSTQSLGLWLRSLLHHLFDGKKTWQHPRQPLHFNCCIKWLLLMRDCSWLPPTCFLTCWMKDFHHKDSLSTGTHILL